MSNVASACLVRGKWFQGDFDVAHHGGHDTTRREKVSRKIFNYFRPAPCSVAGQEVPHETRLAGSTDAAAVLLWAV
jgi:hypothetical protein